jgi:pyruvate,water dikinase
MVAYTVKFEEQASIDKSVVGGKGANLGLLTQAGFPVPSGFCVTTDAHAAFLSRAGLDDQIAMIAASLNYDDADQLEARAGQIRKLIVGAEVPADLANEIARAYGQIGADVLVAVRSSGTAEDLAEASFAGMHDTYLDIRGADALVDAVKRCWASLWTTRATAYRKNKGIEHATARMSVVVQTMVAADVAGVMFTANPLSAATDEIVINATWGLGEALVGGIITPDEFVVRSGTLEMKSQTLGTKTLRIVRDPVAGHGTVTEDVPEADRRRYCLSDEQVVELAHLGRKTQDYYQGLPQDIEWVLTDGQFQLVQSRPITATEFSWDVDCDRWEPVPDDESILWTRVHADEVWCGAISPLMYSWRAPCWVFPHRGRAKVWGFPELADMRFWKFHKSVAYYNCDLEKAWLERLLPTQLRNPMMLSKLPPDWHDDMLSGAFNWVKFAKAWAGVAIVAPEELKPSQYIRENRTDPALKIRQSGLPDEEMRRLSDMELEREFYHLVELEDEYNVRLWNWWFLRARNGLSLQAWMVNNWYDGDKANALSDLQSGTPKRTAALEASLILWELSEEIRNSGELSAIFRDNTDAEFFAALEHSDPGKAFLLKYHEFLEGHGHRGHAERDIYFPRRADDPSLDYQALKVMLSVEKSEHPEVKEAEVNARREAAYEEVLQCIRKKPMGALKAEAFKVIYHYVVQFLIDRDDERWFVDLSSYGLRRASLEVGRRLVDRGLIEATDDVFFLAKEELFELFNGRASLPLSTAKITARRRNFQAYDNKEVTLPKYLKGGIPIDLEHAVEHGDGVLNGIGTARGVVTGTARVVRRLQDIGRVKQGEILVVNATDPGWTPVFLAIRGVVVETGGMGAHASCLAREYGMPCVQLEGAIQLIADGATITVSGDTGQVYLVAEPADEPELELVAGGAG